MNEFRLGCVCGGVLFLIIIHVSPYVVCHSKLLMFNLLFSSKAFLFPYCVLRNKKGHGPSFCGQCLFSSGIIFTEMSLHLHFIYNL